MIQIFSYAFKLDSFTFQSFMYLIKDIKLEVFHLQFSVIFLMISKSFIFELFSI